MRILAAGRSFPAFDRESGGKRIYDFLNMLLDAGHAVSYFALEPEADPRYREVIAKAGVFVGSGGSAVLGRWLSECDFDLAITFFWDVAETIIPLVRLHNASTKIVVDTVDLHFLRGAREAVLKQRQPRSIGVLDRRFSDLMRREINTYAAADHVLTVSQKEREILADYLGNSTRISAIGDCQDPFVGPLNPDERKGMLFLGNFWHRPNRDAVEFLISDIVPQLRSNILAADPLNIVGNGLDEGIRKLASGNPSINCLGWVPATLPFLHCAKLSLAPLRFGAGTKRKLIESMAAGTPAVATTVAAEGLQIANGKELLITDDPAAFASSMEELISNSALRRKLAANGIQYVAKHHAREVVMRQLARTMDAIADGAAPAVFVRQTAWERALAVRSSERALLADTHALLREKTAPTQSIEILNVGEFDLFRPRRSKVAVMSLDRDSRAVNAAVSSFAENGLPSALLVMSDTALALLQGDSHIAAAFQRAEIASRGRVHLFGQPPGPRRTTQNSAVGSLFAFPQVLARRPELATDYRRLGPSSNSKTTALVVGAYFADRPTNIHDIVRQLSRPTKMRVVQRWTALGGEPMTGDVAAVTCHIARQTRGKWELINQLIDRDHEGFDFVVVMDDDIVIPDDFLPAFIDLQRRFSFCIAQPARTPSSYVDYPIVIRQRGTLARRTLFVESGPVVSFSAGFMEAIFPFETISPMGWGHSNVWAAHALRLGRPMGIIDAAPVDHSLRPPAGNYSATIAQMQRATLHGRRTHVSYDDCMRVECGFRLDDCREAVPTCSVGFSSPRKAIKTARPDVSVVIATYDRADLLRACVQSFAAQSIAPDRFEIVVVDDGSKDFSATRAACAGCRNLSLHRINHSGRAGAKNFGACAARGRLVVFFDDDDIAAPDLVAAHLREHESHSEDGVAVLGFTAVPDELKKIPLLEYIGALDGGLFSYRGLVPGQTLDFRYFWEGRISCKRMYLLRNGLHDELMEYYVDIELGWRLQQRGLRIVYSDAPKSLFNRPMTLENLCTRAERKGRALFRLFSLHGNHPEVSEYCAPDKHRRIFATGDSSLRSLAVEVVKMERLYSKSRRDFQRRELWNLYREVSAGFSARGFVNAEKAATTVGEPPDRGKVGGGPRDVSVVTRSA